MNGWTNSNFS